MSRFSASSRKGSNHKDIPPAAEYVDVPAERMGVLSWTLASSPVVRWILPAKIRCRKHNDVVFVGSTYIQLREAHANGRLSDTIARLDFGTQIVNAKVISAKAEKVPVEDAVRNQEWDEERFIVKNQVLADDQPPQIVVLATAMSELIYIYAKDSGSASKVELVFAKRAIIGDISSLMRSLGHMAIDPECKVMATASHSTCTAFRLRDVDDLKTSIDSWNPRKPESFQPNFEQRMFQVDGHILRMDFLGAPKEEPNKVVLLLIVANAGSTLLLLYKWDTREPLHQVDSMHKIVQKLPEQDKFPLLLIPSRKRMSFAIVTETSMVYYDNVRSPAASRLPVPFSQEQQKEIYAQWAKPSRHDGYSNQNEEIFLVREDGLLSVFTRPHNTSTNPTTNFSPGIVKIGVDSAICMLPGPRDMGGDILIVSGSMCDGGVFHLPPRRELYMLQKIPNVSPILDMTMVDSAASKQRNARSNRTFVTAGATGSSSINELRFGLEAQVQWTIPLEGGSAINKLWTIEHVPTKKLFIFTACSDHTTAIAFDLDKQQLEEIHPELYPSLRLDAITLAADLLACNTTVQITSQSIVAGFETSTPQTQAINSCVCADIDTCSGTFTIACRDGFEYTLGLGLVRKSDSGATILLASTVYRCTDRPLCLSLFHLADNQYLSVGYLDGRIEFFSISSEGELALKSTLTSTENDISSVTSITALHHGQTSHTLVLAGTRNGKLKIIKTSLVEDSIDPTIETSLDRTYQISPTQVTVVKEGSGREAGQLSALIQCGSRIDRLTCFANNGQIDYMLANIWLTTRNDLTWVPPNLVAIHRVRHLLSINGDMPSNLLLCVSNDEILCASLTEKEQVIPRRLTLNGKAGRLLAYSKFLNKIIVAGDSVRDIEGIKQDNILPGCPVLHLVNPDGTDNANEHQSKVVFGEPNERVRFLLPWEPTDGNRHFNLIMVGLSDQVNSRLGVVSAKKLLTKPGAVRFKPLLKFAEKELYSICAVDKSCLAIGVADQIILMRLDVATKKWYEDARYRLPSPALSLSAQGTVIYAATQLHSTLVVIWRRSAKVLERVFSDRVARNARAILPFGHNGSHVLVMTASGQGTSFLGHSIKRNSLHIPTPLFEAEMPLGIERIVPIPTAWQASQHSAFQGITFDGTVYILQTLTYNEWKLLRFLEQLIQPDPAKPSKKPQALLTENMARKLIRAGKDQRAPHFSPKKMHIHGDILKRLVEGGPDRLRNLLGTVVKNEDDMAIDGEENVTLSKLESLATAVVGDTNDVVGAVITWTRKLLRSTIF